jgi:hypothetical protein
MQLCVRSVDSHFCFSVMNPASRLVLVTCVRVEAHVSGDDEYHARFRRSFVLSKAAVPPADGWSLPVPPWTSYPLSPGPSRVIGTPFSAKVRGGPRDRW